MKIIGLSGTNGSGKDTVGHLLAQRHDYLFVSVTDMLRNEAKRRELLPNREVLRTISAQWRRDSGLGVLVDKSVEYYHSTDKKYAGLVVASLRNPGEADRVHEIGGTVIWVDADPRVRYERIQANKATRDRKEEDDKTFEQFQAEEAAEMTTSGDNATLNMSEVKARSDVILFNETNDLKTFYASIERALDLA